MEKYFGIDNSFQPSINISLDKITTNKAVEIVNSEPQNVSGEPGVVDVLIAGLDSSSHNSDCYNALVDAYIENPGSNIQFDILCKLTLSDCPNAQYLMEEILSDNTADSLSIKFDEAEKANVVSLMDLDAEERAGEILRQIKEIYPDYPTDTLLDYEMIRGEALRVSYEGITDPMVQNTEGGNDFDLETLMKHITNLATDSNMTEAITTLAEQMTNNPDLGRKVGQLMQQNPDFRDLITKVFLQTSAENPDNKEVLKNTLSYCKNVGKDIAITHMSEDQKMSLIPKLNGETLSDQLYFGQDNLLTRLDEGETISLNTLSNEGIVAIPILLNIKLKH